MPSSVDMKPMSYTLGIESTAHTFSIGLCDDEGNPLPSTSAFVRPVKGGIHPREAADHHAENCQSLIEQLFAKHSLKSEDISAIAFSQGPGLGPCLRIGASVARTISTAWEVPLIGVNHCVAHIEIGRQECDCSDPVLLYVSGGNTQIIARLEGKYRVLGETLDIGIGNMLDKFAREQGIPFPGGPVIEKNALRWITANPNSSLDDFSLPYAVQGMDLAFSGVLTAALMMVAKGAPLDAVCWSLQEHVFAACVEVAERALAHTGKSELLLGGGVACNQKLRNMSSMMAEQRDGECFVPEKQYCIDNGSMIAVLGRLRLISGNEMNIEDSKINQYMRTDSAEITWS